MKKKKNILISVNDKDLANPKLWKNVEIIGAFSFRNCRKIENIEIPSSVEKIENGAFYYTPIKTIVFNEGLKKIESLAFSSCYNLKNVILPDSLEILGDSSFRGSSIEEVTIKDNVKEIGACAFENCNQLKKINLPNSLKKIKQLAFVGTSIKGIELNEGLEEIDNLAFSSCYDLKEIEFPSTIKRLGNEILRSSGVKTIKFKEGIKVISNFAFHSCNKLQHVEIPSSVEVIEETAFEHCTALFDLTLNNGLKEIGNFAFASCRNLSYVEIPSSVKTIGAGAFSSSGIRSIKLKEGIKRIGNNAFGSCLYLNYIEIPFSVEYIDEDAIPNSYFKYLYKTNDRIILTNDKLNNKDIIEKYDISKIDSWFYKMMFREDYNQIYDRILYLKKHNIEYSKNCYKSDEFMNKIFFNNNIDFVKGISKRINVSSMDKKYVFSFYKLLYNLGAYSTYKVDRQKACNFIENLFEKDKLNFILVHEIANKMMLNGFNKEWAEFIMHEDNFYKLLIEEGMEKGFIARTYNDFYKIKELNRSNKGDQRYKKVTIEACAKYIENVSFTNIDDENKDIAETLQKFTRNQEAFDNAVKIRNKYKKLENSEKIKEHIIDEKVIDSDIFNNIEDAKKDIISNIKSTLLSLKNKSIEYFTYEFLSKYDPDNYVLGKYCSCCAHIEGAGYGIMKASILHPDCENLVIRRKDGTIVSKATLYVNRKKGYGVINTIETCDNISEKQKDAIYKKIKKAIDDFVMKYNENNEIKITQINVGMGITNMSDIIKKNLSRGEILEGIDFSKYAAGSRTYSGDWQKEQYIIWKSNKK